MRSHGSPDADDRSVYISYPRDGGAGEEWAAAIAAWLDERAIPCWRDEPFARCDGPLSPRVEAWLEGSRLVLCVVSGATRDCPFVTRELAFAGELAPRPPPVVCVRVEGGAPRPSRGIPWLDVDFTGDPATGWQSLARAVGLPDAAPTAARRVLELAYLRECLDGDGMAFAAAAPVPAPGADGAPVGPGRRIEAFPIRGRLAGADGERRECPDVLEAFRASPRLAVLGPPGAGKSVALGRVREDLARRALGDPAAPLPVLVRLGDWLDPLDEEAHRTEMNRSTK